MIKNALKFIIAAAIMCGVAFGAVFLASSRSLPFLPKEAPEYSTVENSEETSPEISDEPSYPEESSAEESSGTEVSVDEAAAFIGGAETFSPGSFAPLDRRYLAKDEKVVYINAPLPAEESAVTAVRMGFVFLEDGRIFDSAFNDITDIAAGYTFIGARDKAGHPVFKKGDSYYYYNGENGFAPSNYDVYSDATGFEFDVPVYLCEQLMPIKRYYVKKKKYYNFYGDDGDSYAYGCKEVFAFYPFIENGVERGIACTIKRVHSEDRLVFYSTRFRHAGDSIDNTLSDIYYPPESRGIESIGYFYFCDGYIRVRVKNGKNWEERLMDTGCNLARTLNGYVIAGYSDGCILYERNGKYGFTTNSLNWITTPDLISAHPFTEGLAVVQTETGFGMIDTTGAYVLPPVFEKVTPCSGCVFAAYSSGTGWSLFAKIDINSQYVPPEEIETESIEKGDTEPSEESSEPEESFEEEQ